MLEAKKVNHPRIWKGKIDNLVRQKYHDIAQGVSSQALLKNQQKFYTRPMELVLVCIKSCANNKQAWV